MNKKFIISIFALLLLSTACNDFMDISPADSITDDAVWTSASSIEQFMNDVYDQLDGPLYNWTSMSNYMFDNAFTDDMAFSNNKWNLFDFTASSAPFDRWSTCYTSIRKANLGIENISGSTVIQDDVKERYLGDLYFLRGMFYLELFRFYGGLPLIDIPLDRNEDDIFYSRSSQEETLEFIISDFQKAADYLPVTLDDEELGRATRGAAIGMEAITYLFGAGIVDSKYYENAAETADILISGELAGTYSLFANFQHLFLEDYEYNSEVIFDIQYAYPYRFTALQTVAAPPNHSFDSYGWGWDNPTQDLVDAFEMKDGSSFDWNDPEEAANPYGNRDNRFYTSIFYNGSMRKGEVLYTSTNIWDEGSNSFVQNGPNGLWNTQSNSETPTGYYLKKHINESVISGWDNRGKGVGGGHNLIVLRYAEVLLTYAEAKNEVSGPDDSVYKAINLVRERAGQPDLPAGLDQNGMREKIRHERRVELAFENKRYFDIIRWKAGEEYLNNPVHGMNVTYVKDGDSIKPTYAVFEAFKKSFNPNKNYLLPIPQNAINQNPNLTQNPGW